MSKKRNHSLLLLNAKEGNHHKPRQSNAAVVSVVEKGEVKLCQV